jgi:hypothetical protein
MMGVITTKNMVPSVGQEGDMQYPDMSSEFPNVSLSDRLNESVSVDQVFFMLL